MVAQLDGYNAERNCIVEIKCPSAESHANAKRGIIPENYMAQMQHQFEVSGATRGYYVSFDGDNDLVIIDVKPDPDYIARILVAEQAFYISMQEMEPPTESALPPIERTDVHYMNLIARYEECKEKADLYSSALADIKEQIIEASDGRSCMSNGFTVTKSIRKGNVNYGIIPQLKGVDLDQYRGKDSETWTIRKK
jgi:predicted phage-related endonuclease